MEPRIQYAKTRDGVNIAFYIRGEGRSFVHMPAIPFGHIHLDSQDANLRQWFESISHHRTLIRYAGRGVGMSQRDVTEISLETNVQDLEAVVDQLALPEFVLWGHMNSAPPAIAYAAKHPDRVSHLILWCGFAKGSELRSQRARALRGLLDSDWELYTESVAHFLLGYPEGEPSRRFAALYRETIGREIAAAYVDAIRRFDVRHLLADVKAPVLLLHRREVPWPDVSVARELAAGMADAHLCLIEGKSGAPFIENMEASLAAISEFLGDGNEASAATLPPNSIVKSPLSGTAIILFADIVDSTALTERLGDDAFREKARGLDEAMRAAIRANGGTAVEGKTLGDGVLAVFTSAKQAIACAQACHDAANTTGLALHVGIHAGDVIRESDNVYGGAVNIAARVAAASAPGETLVSQTVRDLARTSAGVAFEDRGEQALKGIDDPMRVFSVTSR